MELQKLRTQQRLCRRDNNIEIKIKHRDQVISSWAKANLSFTRPPCIEKKIRINIVWIKEMHYSSLHGDSRYLSIKFMFGPIRFPLCEYEIWCQRIIVTDTRNVSPGRMGTMTSTSHATLWQFPAITLTSSANHLGSTFPVIMVYMHIAISLGGVYDRY